MFAAATKRALLASSHVRTAATAAPKRTWIPRPRSSPTAAATPPLAATPKPATLAPAPAVGSSIASAPADEWDGPDFDDLPLPEIPSTSSPLPTRASAPTSTSTPTSAAAPFPATNSAFPSSAIPTQGAPTATAPFPAAAASPFEIPSEQREIDWSTSYHGLSAQPFSEKAAVLLMRPLVPSEIEIKPDGLLYLPEILYRRILNQAFGPGGWGMVPRGEMTVLKMMVSREWGLVAGGRLVSVARGEQTFFDPSGLPTATEGCKSNALMRCCKDLGIASELWDPAFIRTFKAQYCVEAWTEHASTKKKQKRWRKKGNKFEYPLIESKM